VKFSLTFQFSRPSPTPLVAPLFKDASYSKTLSLETPPFSLFLFPVPRALYTPKAVSEKPAGSLFFFFVKPPSSPPPDFFPPPDSFSPPPQASCSRSCTHVPFVAVFCPPPPPAPSGPPQHHYATTPPVLFFYPMPPPRTLRLTRGRPNSSATGFNFFPRFFLSPPLPVS